MIKYLYPKFVKNLKTQQGNDTIKIWAKDLKQLIREDIQKKNKHMKRCSTSYVIRKLN